MFLMMDADNLTVAKCLHDLDEQLTGTDQDRIDKSRDRIARLIPRWSIETWLLDLSSSGNTGTSLSEETSYKNSKNPEQWDQMTPRALQTLYGWTMNAASRPDNLLDSLQRGLAEIPRALPVRR